jgi:hypothetical protein
MIDYFQVYSFIKRLVTPFNEWEAYKTGVIDENGKVIVPKNRQSQIQKDSFNLFDRLVANIKKIMAKVPGGDSKLASYAAALYLLKEHNLFIEDSYILSEETNNFNESNFINYINNILKEDAVIVGSGNIAGTGIGPQGEPGMSKNAMIKYKKKNKIGFSEDIYDLPSTPSYSTPLASQLIKQVKRKKYPIRSINLTPSVKDDN